MELPEPSFRCPEHGATYGGRDYCDPCKRLKDQRTDGRAPIRIILEGGNADADPLRRLADEAYEAILFAGAEYVSAAKAEKLRHYAMACLRELRRVQGG